MEKCYFTNKSRQFQKDTSNPFKNMLSRILWNNFEFFQNGVSGVSRGRYFYKSSFQEKIFLKPVFEFQTNFKAFSKRLIGTHMEKLQCFKKRSFLNLYLTNFVKNILILRNIFISRNHASKWKRLVITDLK